MEQETMMKLIKIVLSSTILLYLAACAAAAPSTITQSPTLSPSATFYQSATANLSATADWATMRASQTEFAQHQATVYTFWGTEMAKTSTPTETITPIITPSETLTPETWLKTQCLEVASTLPKDYMADGSILLGLDRPKQVFLHEELLDMKTGITQPIPLKDNEGNLYFSVSPDGKWLIYNKFGKDNNNHEISNNLIVLTEGGKVYKNISLNLDQSVFWLKWINNSIVQVDLYQEPGYFLNPFTGEKKALPEPFPDQETIFGMAAFTSPSYDPTMTRVIYPGMGQTTALLRDLQSGGIITSLNQDIGGPEWSPDGKQLVAVVRYGSSADLYLLSRDGQLTQATFMRNQFSEVIISDLLSWSPDGRYVAFWLTTNTEKTPNARLAVLNTQTRIVTDYCLTGLSSSGLGISNIVWAPNGKQLVVEDDQHQMVVVDFEKEIAAPFGKNMSPDGWMAP